MSLSRKKIVLIHVAKARLGLADEQYRKLLEASVGVRSAKELDDAGFEELMRCFKRLGFESNAARATFGHRPGMATPSQVGYIRKAWREYSGSDNEQALNHWLEHKFHVSALRFADTETAHKAITALRHMTARRRAHHA
jgi:phage gp16-like protein